MSARNDFEKVRQDRSNQRAIDDFINLGTKEKLLFSAVTDGTTQDLEHALKHGGNAQLKVGDHNLLMWAIQANSPEKVRVIIDYLPADEDHGSNLMTHAIFAKLFKVDNQIVKILEDAIANPPLPKPALLPAPPHGWKTLNL